MMDPCTCRLSHHGPMRRIALGSSPVPHQRPTGAAQNGYSESGHGTHLMPIGKASPYASRLPRNVGSLYLPDLLSYISVPSSPPILASGAHAVLLSIKTSVPLAFDRLCLPSQQPLAAAAVR